MERKTFYLSKLEKQKVERLAKKLKVTESEIARFLIRSKSDDEIITYYKS